MSPASASTSEAADEDAQAAAATTTTTTTATAEEEKLASSDSVLMPAFEEGRDQQGLSAAAKVDFRNVKPGQIVPIRPIGTARGVGPARSLVITGVKVVEDPTRTFKASPAAFRAPRVARTFAPPVSWLNAPFKSPLASSKQGFPGQYGKSFACALSVFIKTLTCQFTKRIVNF